MSTDDRPWMPCPLCRSHYAVQRPHWRAFVSAGDLERHLKDNLPKTQQESGGLRAIIIDWQQHDRYRTMKAEACYKPVSLTQMFEQETVAKVSSPHSQKRWNK
jgi:hypothetical protein